MLLTAEAAAAIPPWVPPDDYPLRAYEPSDQDALAELLILCGPDSIWSAEKLAQCLGAPGCKDSARLIVNENQRLIGSAWATYREDDMQTATLGGVAIHPEHRGQGLGFGSCAVVIAFLVERGYSPIGVGTGRNNLPARRLYEKLGFKYQ